MTTLTVTFGCRLRNEKDEANDKADQLDQQLKECQQSIHNVESDRDDLNRKVRLCDIERKNSCHFYRGRITYCLSGKISP